MIVFEKHIIILLQINKSKLVKHEQKTFNKTFDQWKYKCLAQPDFKVVLKGMLKKYDTQFNFFSAKTLTQLIFDQALSPDVIMFKDVMALTEKNQNLKRFYFLKNSYGHKQVEQRIKKLADFYAEHPMLSYQYPTMILTKTKHIFQRRLKRIQRQQNGYDSSNDDDQDEQKQSLPPICGSFSYLKQQASEVIQKHSDEDEDECGDAIHKILLDESRYSSSIHDIYQECQEEQSTENSLNKIKKAFALSAVFPLERQVNHLVYDFQDIDEQRIKLQYQALQRKNNAQKRQKIRNMVNKVQQKTGLITSTKQIQSPKNINKFTPKNQPKKNQPQKNSINQHKISVNQLNQNKNYNQKYNISGLASPKNLQSTRMPQYQNHSKMVSEQLGKQQGQEIKNHQQKSDREMKIQQILKKHRKNSQVVKQQSRKLDQIQQRKRQIEYLKSKQNDRNQLQISRQIEKQGQKNEGIKRLHHVKSETKLNLKVQGGKKLDLNRLIVTSEQPNASIANKSTIILNRESQQEQSFRLTDSGFQTGPQARTSYTSNYMKGQFEQQTRNKYQSPSQIIQNKTGYTYINRQMSQSEEITLNKSENQYHDQGKLKTQMKHNRLSKQGQKTRITQQGYYLGNQVSREEKLFKHVKSTQNLNKICSQDGGTYKEYKSKWKQ